MRPGRELGASARTGSRAEVLVALAAWLLAVGACSSSKLAATDAGPGSGGAAGTGGTGGKSVSTDGGADVPGASADASPGPDAGTATCQQVRLCAFGCSSEACVDTCRQRGSAAAQAAFAAVTSCTQGSAADGGGGCPPVSDPGYRNCLCLAQCLEEPPCAATLDPCLGNIDDSVCDACDS
jgi:hypothetical protein